jgi:hypothetical protein
MAAGPRRGLDYCRLLDIFEFESFRSRKDGKQDYQGGGGGAAEEV